MNAARPGVLAYCYHILDGLADYMAIPIPAGRMPTGKAYFGEGWASRLTGNTNILCRHVF